ncbi:MAG TPA: OmpA family protein [bacterium]|nr:OmpA family protein [bacterium]
MRKYIIILVSFVLVGGCVAGGKLYKSTLLESKRLEVDKNRGADICAPYDIAMAESHIEFARLELEAGNHYRAEEHMTAKDLYATKASMNADACIPKDADGDAILDVEDRCPKDAGTVEFKGCPDRDGDGLPDIDDKCPDVPGPVGMNGCPPAADRDGDGIPDSTDRCPDDKGFAELKGCPDRDGDGLADLDDSCPDIPGVVELKGCPPAKDRDGDGVPDRDDSCPDQKGTPELKGCPPAADRDGDGIPDNADRCPDDKGSVEFKGCPDRDSDGIADIDDKCPDAIGPKELQGCPPAADRDGDGIPDSEDRCPDDKGVVTLKGCPDRDGDNVADLDDKCPDVPGTVELNGCPKILDKDGDGINDDVDKCPDVPGVEEEKGCPKKYKLIVVTAKKIELKQVVLFQTGKAVIDRKSYDMLKEVADALKNAPSVKKIIVEGHTDNIGNRDLNISLSQKRAEAVREFLVDEGVDSDKLEAKGYGPDKPVSSNRTAAGKAKNRRVEFVLEQ